MKNKFPVLSLVVSSLLFAAPAFSDQEGGFLSDGQPNMLSSLSSDAVLMNVEERSSARGEFFSNPGNRDSFCNANGGCSNTFDVSYIGVYGGKANGVWHSF